MTMINWKVFGIKYLFCSKFVFDKVMRRKIKYFHFEKVSPNELIASDRETFRFGKRIFDCFQVGEKVYLVEESNKKGRILGGVIEEMFAKALFGKEIVYNHCFIIKVLIERYSYDCLFIGMEETNVSDFLSPCCQAGLSIEPLLKICCGACGRNISNEEELIGAFEKRIKFVYPFDHPFVHS